MHARPFVTSRADAQSTLLDFLARRLRLSKKKTKAILDARRVHVNDQRVWMARHRLKTGDRVAVSGPDDPASSRPPPSVCPPILFEDADVLVVDKPAGLLSNEGDSVERRVSAHRGPNTLQAVHRLDRETTGCLLLARHERARATLVEHFRKRRVGKLYHVLVWGCLAQPEPILTDKLDGRTAVTRLRVLDANRQATHLRAYLETGRTHQIRKHLLRHGHPVVGDRQYEDPGRARPDFEVHRQMLHALRIEFPHPTTGRTLRIEAPLPRDFKSALKRLRLS